MSASNSRPIGVRPQALITKPMNMFAALRKDNFIAEGGLPIVTYDGEPITYNDTELTVPELFNILTYDYNKEKDILNIPEVFTFLNEVVASRPAGVYIIGFSINWAYASTTRSAIFRFSADGGVTWTDYTHEPKDKTDIQVVTYSSSVDHNGGTIQFLIEGMKEDAAGTFDVHGCDIWIQRVADLVAP